jgi:hypothetical protein
MIRDFFNGAREPIVFAARSFGRLVYGALCFGLCGLVLTMFGVLIGTAIRLQDPGFNAVTNFPACMGLAALCIVGVTGICNVVAGVVTRRSSTGDGAARAAEPSKRATARAGVGWAAKPGRGLIRDREGSGT